MIVNTKKIIESKWWQFFDVWVNWLAFITICLNVITKIQLDIYSIILLLIWCLRIGNNIYSANLLNYLDHKILLLEKEYNELREQYGRK